MIRLPSIVTAPRTPRRNALLGAFVASVTVVVAVLSVVAAPTFFKPMGYRRPELLGVPVELIFMAFAVAWGAIGGYVVGTRRSPWVLPVVLIVFTLPACLVIILGPAFVLILENLR